MATAGEKLNQQETSDVADADVLWIAKSATTDPIWKVISASDLQTYMSGGSGTLTPDRVVVESANTPATPAIAFGDGDSGFFEVSDDAIRISLGGTSYYAFTTAGMGPANSGRGGFINFSPSATQPSVVPVQSDTNTGIGSAGADQLSLVAGGTNCISIAENAAAPEVGFYGTTPVAQQTGVAVSAAGIHAALVSLGLITA